MSGKRRTRQHIIADLAVNHVDRSIRLAGDTAERVCDVYGIDLFMRSFSLRTCSTLMQSNVSLSARTSLSPTVKGQAVPKYLSDVTYGRFDEALKSLGFEALRTEEGFRMNLHRPSDTSITVPGGADVEVMPIRHVEPNVTLLDLQDVTERDRFETVLHIKRVA